MAKTKLFSPALTKLELALSRPPPAKVCVNGLSRSFFRRASRGPARYVYIVLVSPPPKPEKPVRSIVECSFETTHALPKDEDARRSSASDCSSESSRAGGDESQMERASDSVSLAIVASDRRNQTQISIIENTDNTEAKR
jgi:hypothetical protein